jgi:chromosome partitioning protein
VNILAVINQKGGVGKTTTTVNLGAALARRGRRVLLVDLDPQANLTIHVDRRPDLASPTITNVLLEEKTLADVIVPAAADGLFVVPADTSLGGIEQVLANRIGRETILRDAFEALAAAGSPAFDDVLLDCPPSLGVLSANALVAADEVVVPIQAEYFSLQGMAKLTEVVDLVRRRLNPKLRIRSILPCMVDLRTRLRGEVLGEVGRHFGDVLSPVSIRNNVKLAEAPSFGQTIFEHAPDSNGALDYAAFADHLLAGVAGAQGDPASEPSGRGERAETIATPGGAAQARPGSSGAGGAEAAAGG